MELFHGWVLLESLVSGIHHFQRPEMPQTTQALDAWVCQKLARRHVVEYVVIQAYPQKLEPLAFF